MRVIAIRALVASTEQGVGSPLALPAQLASTTRLAAMTGRLGRQRTPRRGLARIVRLDRVLSLGLTMLQTAELSLGQRGLVGLRRARRLAATLACSVTLPTLSRRIHRPGLRDA